MLGMERFGLGVCGLGFRAGDWRSGVIYIYIYIFYVYACILYTIYYNI